MLMLVALSSHTNAQKRFETPGDNLRYAAQQSQMGDFMFICAIGAYALWLNKGHELGEEFKYAAPGIALVGIIFKISASNYQNRAGIQLNQKTALTTTSDGFGLVLRL